LSYLRPKPVQKPHPPILIGGDSDATVKRVIRHGRAGSRTHRRSST
jgi:alkanesulfonate monooxygenase SsuD/methylene tetrahydromethanopterin reductase-like flavin-dependent oxidoreductase (luciferase family)